MLLTGCDSLGDAGGLGDDLGAPASAAALAETALQAEGASVVLEAEAATALIAARVRSFQGVEGVAFFGPNARRLPEAQYALEAEEPGPYSVSLRYAYRGQEQRQVILQVGDQRRSFNLPPTGGALRTFTVPRSGGSSAPETFQLQAGANEVRVFNDFNRGSLLLDALVFERLASRLTPQDVFGQTLTFAAEGTFEGAPVTGTLTVDVGDLPSGFTRASCGAAVPVSGTLTLEGEGAAATVAGSRELYSSRIADANAGADVCSNSGEFLGLLLLSVLPSEPTSSDYFSVRGDLLSTDGGVADAVINAGSETGSLRLQRVGG